MSDYQHIVIAVDLSHESHDVVSRATQLSPSKLTLVHVIEPLTFAYGGDIPMDLSEVQLQLQNQAKDKLHELAQKFSIAEVDCIVVVGQPASEIHQIADDKQCDLIVVGSHGRSGLALLLGSTANGVLHGANCDVLAVRIHPSE